MISIHMTLAIATIAAIYRQAPQKFMPVLLCLFLVYLTGLVSTIMMTLVLFIGLVGYTIWQLLLVLPRLLFNSTKYITILMSKIFLSAFVFIGAVLQRGWRKLDIIERLYGAIRKIHFPSYTLRNAATRKTPQLPPPSPSSLPCRFSECYICYEQCCEGISKDAFDLGEDVAVLEEVLHVIWCRGCWHPVHEGCWKNWRRYELAQRRPLLCAFCRTPWDRQAQ